MSYGSYGNTPVTFQDKDGKNLEFNEYGLTTMVSIINFSGATANKVLIVPEGAVRMTIGANTSINSIYLVD